MRNLTCIVCPIGCALEVDGGADGNLIINGNKCPRGNVYAQEEIKAPKRIVTATASLITASASIRRVPVKTSVPCLREKIPALLDDIYKVKVSLPVKAGDAVIADWKGEGIDVVATRTIV
ncbi:MAG: DUF1667 domain-containing protein [Treponema sp.]|nr:DUF1667 domain-containing protein [Treponema sp.]